MAFQLRNIKIQTKSRESDLLNYIENICILPLDITDALKGYVRCKTRTTGTRCITTEILKKSVPELLEKCCGKPMEELTYMDIRNNDGAILDKIQRAAKSNSYWSIYKIYLDDNLTFRSEE